MVAIEINAIARAASARIIDTFPEDSRISRILFDSRKLTAIPGTLFVAMAGQHRDGHDFVIDMYTRGVRNFLLSKAMDMPGRANVLVVEDGLKAVQSLAAAHRDSFAGRMIGITGSNGKTVVKEWIYQGLHQIFSIVRSPRSFNSQLGVALSLLEIEPYHDLAVIEAGISFPGEMERLAMMIRPHVGVLTTLGPAHDEHFSSREEKLKEKLLLFQNAEVLIFPADDELIQAGIERMIPPEVIRWSWGRQGTAIKVLDVAKLDQGTRLHVEIGGKGHFLSLPFRDDASIENSLSLCTVLLYFHLEPDVIQIVLDGLLPLEMRLEVKEGINGCTLINDSYSSDLMSLEIALDFLIQQDDGRELMVILSDILQTGMSATQLYSGLARQLNDRHIEHVIGIGSDIQCLGEVYQGNAVFYDSAEEFLQKMDAGAFRNRIVLLKGARSFRFERIASRLQKKAHETILQINLNALVHNLKYFQSMLEPGTRVMAMVKAFGYGSGTREIASVLQFHKVDYLAVAYADEGYDLRMAGIRLPIMIMNPDPDSLVSSLHHNLEPEIFGIRILDELIASLGRYPDIPVPVGIHIKIDTGMHRLGFLPEEVPALLQRLKKEGRIRVLSIFTHLAASEDADEDAFTLHQISLFNEVCDMATFELGYPFLKHVLNSAGIGRFK
ncbi:MAG: alanine racemase, partial [Bacteroidales bacterium]|nr:alanine racemase [Bacteroidales bacterium]